MNLPWPQVICAPTLLNEVISLEATACYLFMKADLALDSRQVATVQAQNGAAAQC